MEGSQKNKALLVNVANIMNSCGSKFEKQKKKKSWKPLIHLCFSARKFLPQVTNITSFLTILPEKIDASTSMSKKAFFSTAFVFKRVLKSECWIYTDTESNNCFSEGPEVLPLWSMCVCCNFSKVISKTYLISTLQCCGTYFMALVFVPNITLLYIEFIRQFERVRPRWWRTCCA